MAVFRHKSWLHPGSSKGDRCAVIGVLIEKLQQLHAGALEGLFKDWETRWRDCRECLAEIIPSAKILWERNASERQSWLTYYGYAVAKRIGEMDEALRILKQEEAFHAGRSDREALEVLQRSYGNQALILQAWGAAGGGAGVIEQRFAWTDTQITTELL